MNLLKPLAVAALVVGFTMNVAIAAVPTTPPTCGVTADTDAGATPLTIDAKASRFHDASKHVKFWTKGHCKGDDAEFYDQLADDCEKASQHGGKRRENKQGDTAVACVTNFNAWVALNTAANAAAAKAKADADAAAAAAAAKAKADACDAISGSMSPITAGATEHAVCACRNKYQAQSGDKTVYDADAKTVPQDTSSTSTYTWLMKNIRTLAAGQTLVDGNNCCIVFNGGQACNAQQP